MTLWFVFALMTAAAIFAVLWPLGRGNRTKGDGSEAAVYRDQLAEVDRDVSAGLIGAPEAAAARVEISRRLLAAADAQRRPPPANECRIAPRWLPSLRWLDCPSWRLALLSTRFSRSA